MSWFWREKEIYNRERKAWDTLGFLIDEEALEKQSQLIYTGNIEYEGRGYEFKIIYPEGYPYIAPSVKCLSVENEKHQSPISQSVCYHEEWKDYGIVGAKDIIPQLHKWIEGINIGFNPEDESEAAEPILYESASNREGILLTPKNVYGDWTGKMANFEMRVQFQSHLIQAELTKIKNNDETIESKHAFFPKGETYKGICFNVDEPPPLFESNEPLLKWLEEKLDMKEIKTLCKFTSLDNPNLGPLLGIRYPNNGEYHFLVVSLLDTRRSEYHTKLEIYRMIVFKSHAMSESDLFKRVSHLSPLRDKHVVMVGVGAIGSPVALELSKAGIGKLTLVDSDVVMPGNVVRHIANFEHIGLPKVEAVSEICKKHNPYLTVVKKQNYWGYTDEYEVMNVLREADLIVCAVDHSPIERYVNDVARRAKVPVIYTYSSLGAVSGRVFLVENETKGCYHCHQYAIGEGKVPALMHADSLEIYEEGCAGPAYLGSGIDTATIALHASRLALQTLLNGHPEAYEEANYNHMVWYSQTGKGKIEAIQLSVLPKENCPYCETKEEVNAYDIVTQAKELLNAATDYEEALVLGELDLNETSTRFKQIEDTFKGKYYLNEHNEKIELTRVFINEEMETKNWCVAYKTDSGEIKSEIFDDFFGYVIRKHELCPRYQPIS